MAVLTTDQIRKEITLKASPGRVWQALTQADEFGSWFGVRLEGEFVVGETISGQITTPGYEHLVLRARVVRMDPVSVFAFRWCPYALDPEVDYSGHPTTEVEFTLEETAEGVTRLTMTESGFDSIPEEHRSESYKRNEGGWSQQMINIRDHVGG